MFNKKSSVLFWICALSLVAAVGTHIYLTNHHYKVKFGLMGDEGGLCNISETVNCDRTSASSYSEVLGIPVSILGGVLNLLLLGLLLAFRFPIVSPKTQEQLKSPLRLISLGIFATSLVMGAISYFVLHAICPACTTAYALSLVTVVTAFMITPKAPLFSMANVKLYGGLAISLFVVSYITHLSTQSEYGGSEVLKMVEYQLNDWKAKPSKSLNPVSPLVMHPEPGSKMKMVEFADFLCGHCAKAFPIIHKFAKSHPDVEFSFQAFPLDGECNSAIQTARGTSCFLARASHCAGQQTDPWKVQEWMFKNQAKLLSTESAKQMFAENAESLGFDNEMLMACTDNEETREIIRQQAKLGVDVGVNGTPSLYINGKKVPSGFSIPLLQKIYQYVSAKSATTSEP